MQTAANYQDMSAVDALWTLYRQQSQWVRNALRDRINSQDEKQESEQLKPYTMEEINARIDQAEADSAAGRYRSAEEVFGDWGMALDEEEERKAFDLPQRCGGHIE